MTSGVSTQAMTRNVPPHTPQCSMSMWKTRLRRCIQLMGEEAHGVRGHSMSPVGDDVVAVFDVRGEHAVVSGEVSAGARHEGGEAGDKVHRVEHEPGGEEAEAFQCEAAELVEHLGDDERNDERGRLSGEQLAQRTRSEQFEHHGISVSQVARMTTVQSATATGMNRRSRFSDSGSSAPIRERPARASPDRAHPGGRHVECAQTRPTPFTTSPATLGASSRGFPLLIR